MGAHSEGRHDYANKAWLRRRQRPLWMCLINAAQSRMRRFGRRAAGFDPLPRGIQIRVEDRGLAYIEPVPAR